MYQFILNIKSLIANRFASNGDVAVSIVNRNGWQVEALRLESDFYSAQRELSFFMCLITASRLLSGGLKVSQLKNC